MAGRASKQKGATYERELSLYLNTQIPGMAARRALLSGGGRSDGGADLDNTPGIHIEAKRTERIDIKGALRQAQKAAKGDARPVVITRQNLVPTGESIVALRLDHFVELYKVWLERNSTSSVSTSIAAL